MRFPNHLEVVCSAMATSRSRNTSRLANSTTRTTLPVVSTDDRVFWAGDRRVVVGPAVLAPRAIATWWE